MAGTKGKGSTSAFISTILTQYIRGPSQSAPLFNKIGLYTSPHLRFVRERIQINNKPISEELFAKYFFEIWDRLEASAAQAGLPTDTSAKPVYFRFLTLMAFHTFLKEGVDTAIVECGIGGEYDTTNILEAPTVTGITSLGIDHTTILGDTIEEIAWHKAGIMKAGARCFSSLQPQSALKVLHDRATERGVALQVVDRHPEIDSVKLGLAADFQKSNASLAIAMASAHLRAIGHNHATAPLPTEFVLGLERVRWPGRCEIRLEDSTMWHIDSGHTLESIEVAASWFASRCAPSFEPSSNRPRVLLFNQQTRDAEALVRTLYRTLAETLKGQRPFTHAVFCTNRTWKETGFGPDLISINTNAQEVKALEVQKRLAETWKGIDPETQVVVRESIEEAVEWVRGLVGTTDSNGEDRKSMALVTGSTHLVGGFLEVLETGKKT